MPVYNNEFTPSFLITDGQLADVTFYTRDHVPHKTVGVYAPQVVKGCRYDEYPMLLDNVVHGRRHTIPNTKVILPWQQAIYGEGHKFLVGVCVFAHFEPFTPEDTTLKFRQFEINQDMRQGGKMNDLATNRP